MCVIFMHQLNTHKSYLKHVMPFVSHPTLLTSGSLIGNDRASIAALRFLRQKVSSHFSPGII